MSQQERVRLKQKYLYDASPVHGDFEQERSRVLELMFRDMKRFRTSSYDLRGFDPIFLIERFKLTYGLYNDELEALLVVLADMLLTSDARNVETRILILKALNYLLDYKTVLPNLRIDNSMLLEEYRSLMEKAADIPIKYLESYVEELNTFTRKASKYGKDITMDVLNLTIEQREMKYLALFIPCLEDEKNGDTLLEEIMCESGSWDRDCHWFFVISKIVEKFPQLDFSRYFHTIFQTVIKNFNSIEENSEADLPGVLLPDDITGIRSVLRSDADILIGLIVPKSNPMCNTVWSYIERLLTLIVSPLNPTSHPTYLSYHTIFLRYIIKNFLKRYKKQCKKDIGELINDDQVMFEDDNGWLVAEARHQTKSKKGRPAEYCLDDYCLSEFKRLMKMVLPKLLIVDEGGSDIARMCLELFSFDMEFLDVTYQGILDTLMSEETAALSTAKMVLLFSYEFTIMHAKEKIHILVQCCNRMLELVDKLGLVDHLDMIQLMVRMFMYFPKDEPDIESLKHDLMNLLFENLDSFSNVLQLTDNSLAELYLDLQNIFLPLLLSLTPAQISRYADRLAYKATSAIPKHTQSYQILVVGFSYLQPKLPSLMLPGIVRQLLKKGKSQAYYDVFEETDWCLTTTTEDNIRWFSMLIECTYQYQPDNIVRDFETIQRILVLMLKEDNVVVTECGWDILHNIVIALATQHLPSSNFNTPKNGIYDTLQVTWRQQTPEELKLLLHILQKYVYRLVDFVKNRFADVKPRSDPNRIVDAIMVPKAVSMAALEEKKLLTKILSIQQAVVSALLPRTQNLPDPKGKPVLQFLQPHMIPEFKTLRVDMVKYLDRVMDIMDELHIISEPALAKIYSYFFNEVHGDCYVSDSLSATQEKMTGLIATSVAKPVKHMNNPFLILNEVILAYHCRLQLLNNLFPTAEAVHPGYLIDLTVLSLHPHFTISAKSFFQSPECDLHEYHFQVLNIWWQKLDYSNPNSYFRELEKPDLADNRKERYNSAISNIIQNLKKTATYISMQCCLKDNRIRKILYNFVGVYDRLDKKKDRILLVETLFTLFAFRFNWQLVLPIEENTNGLPIGFAHTSATNKTYSLFLNAGPIIIDPLVQPTKAETIGCIEEILNQSITKLNTKKQTKELALYALFNLMYFPLVVDNKQLLTRMFLCFQKLCTFEQHELNEMGRVGIFHFVNVLSRAQIKKQTLPNTPAKKPFTEFAMFRTFACPENLLTKANCNKYDNVFHQLPTIKVKENIPVTADTDDPYKKTVLQFLSNPIRLLAFFKGCHGDKQLIEDTIQDNDPIKTQGKAILSKCLRIMNCLLDRDPKKMNIFANLADNFAVYQYSFYLRLLKKMVKVGGTATVVALEKVVEEFSKKQQIYAKKLCAHMSISVLKYSQNTAFIDDYLEMICTCPNDIFLAYLSGMSYVFRQNPFTIKTIYAKIMDKLKKVKGSARLRYIEVWKVYVLSQGRWARNESLDGIEWMLGGISEASEELADGLVALTAESFMLPLNLRVFGDWVQQQLYQLIRGKKVFKINDKVGFEIHAKLNQIFGVISNKIQQQKDLQSANLKMYTKLAARILESLTVYHFNDYFYDLFSGIISYIIEKSLDDVNQQDILKRLGESEYPDSVYRKLRIFLQDLQGCTIPTTKRKLKYLETAMFCHGFSFNDVDIPNLLHSQNSVTLVHVSTLGNICKVMTSRELTQRAEEAIASTHWTRYPLLMAYLIASGSMNYEWRVPALTVVVKWKMRKLLREFVAQWWKGRGEGFKGEETLATIVKSVENHYNYFA